MHSKSSRNERVVPLADFTETAILLTESQGSANTQGRSSASCNAGIQPFAEFEESVSPMTAPAPTPEPPAETE